MFSCVETLQNEHLYNKHTCYLQYLLGNIRLFKKKKKHIKDLQMQVLLLFSLMWKHI